MRRRSEKMKKGSEEKEKEVEELLRAAEDEMLLKFSVNSHTTRSKNLDLELLRRFDALKSPSSSAVKKESSSNSVRLPKSEKKDVVDELDLSTRFEALKEGKGEGASSSSKRSTNGFESENEEDEVAKVIQWAMDAAHLDPSKTDDDDDDDDEDEDFEDDDDDDDDDDDEDERKRKPKK